METSKLKKFAQFARRSLIEQVSNKLKLVLAEGSAARRENAEAVKKLEEQIKAHDKGQVIEKVAYIWFNRFCALRFMDVNRYTRIGVVSPAEGQFQPEILAEAKMGHIDEGMVPESSRKEVFALLDGTAPSQDPQSEAYRLLVVAACNDYNKAMPYLFERIADYTELLMPDDLLSGNSILAYTREAMTPDVCEDVEVIGWLYQFYISEKKDEVFDGLKKNKKITPENIPAATQLFTPHWIVRYLVENSLGRLWMLNHPNSRLVERMDYYIKPEQAETDFLRISSLEEIKICDPACGSGHMLTYAFDLLYAIYEEEGYEPTEISEKILTHNLYGIEIDERAGELAAFALTMKARAKQRRFFRKQVQPNICVLENIQFDEGELKEYMNFVGRDLFTASLQTTLSQFEEADNFGSLIRPDLADVDEIVRVLEAKDVSGQLFLKATHDKALQTLRQADYLSPKYHVVIANPPYMGSKGMNGRLGVWAKENYKISKADLFAMFMVRTIELTIKNGFMGMINLPSWLFLSSFEDVRTNILDLYSIESMLHMGRGIFGIDWGSTAFVIKKTRDPLKVGAFFRLHKRNFQHIYYQDIANLFLNAKNNPEYRYNFDQYRNDEGINCINSESHSKGLKLFYRASAADFKKIPTSPIAYWVSPKFVSIFNKDESLRDFGINPATGLQTGDNGRFIRYWYEVSDSRRENIWISLNDGGDVRKWYGNFTSCINWGNEGSDIKAHKSSVVRNVKYYFREGATWNRISSTFFSIRYLPEGFIFDQAGDSLFAEDENDLYLMMGFLNSPIGLSVMKIICPTLNATAGNLELFPYPKKAQFARRDIRANVVTLINEARKDWDAYETSWNFTSQPLLNPGYRQPSLKTTYQKLRALWQEVTLKMRRLEEENNRIFIDAYGLQDELTSEVSLNEITLTCNPHYRYAGNKSEDELEALLLADTMKEFISYAVGCMFGRYALEKPDLVLANQGETITDYLKQIPDPSFPADDDNVIPMLDGDWFTDDITERFYRFLRVTFGEENYEENLKFIEQTIGKKLRKYFLKDFYNDHVKRYKKRPIYWLFSSPKGSFNALIYMHRYRPDTVSVVLNDYLREFSTKLTARKNHLEAVSISASASQGEKTRALKEIEKLNKMITEMEDYERDVLYPLATEQVEIDLDDGVKVNYNKFGAALKKVTGLSGKG